MRAGGGFSGSIIARLRNDDLDVFGILSGPPWNEPLKTAIKQATAHYANQRTSE
jgi:hypothetical protein